jgi:hypothetical protein
LAGSCYRLPSGHEPSNDHQGPRSPFTTTGSYSELAQLKARVLNAFVAEKNIARVIERGCGDGNQLQLARIPATSRRARWAELFLFEKV